ncbi:MAG: tetratricopeptide repeat protein [Planctomycetes bacterium]|nr:tetratricopeptide repeat protein [Planctomycetota bacterium]
MTGRETARRGQLRLSASSNAETASRLITEGNVHFHRGDYLAAIASYTESIRLHPTPAGYDGRAKACLQRNELGQAIADCDEAIRLDPAFFLAFVTRAVAHFLGGDIDRAIADNTEAIRLNPNYVVAYRNRGREYSQSGDYKLAIADYTEAIRLEPKNAGAYSDRGYVQAMLGNYQEAITDCTEAIRLDPNLAVAYHNRALAYRAIGDEGRAQADIATGNQLAPAWQSTWTSILVFWLIVIAGAIGLVYLISLAGQRP